MPNGDKAMRLDEGKTLYEDLARRIRDIPPIDNVVAVTDVEPTEEGVKIWLPETPPQAIQVPTYAEFQQLEQDVDAKVSDVQVNGTSVVNDGVANIPVASPTSFGVVKTDANSFGIKINEEGRLYTVTPGPAEIKAGTQAYKPIVPATQYMSAFYGLAKAAGDATQSASSNAVGTYTAEAKTAIQTMLGVPGDVQVNGTSVVENGVANIPIASSNGVLGVIYPDTTYGTGVNASGRLFVQKSSASQIKGGAQDFNPIVPLTQHTSVYYGLAKLAGVDLASGSDTVGVYPANAKTAIQTMLGVEQGVTFVETVTGTTPTITGQPNVRYICGEVSLLTITPPSAGTITVIFESGSTPTVLTLPNTVKFPEWVDISTLEANTTYEIIITDGVYGGVMSWAD